MDKTRLQILVSLALFAGCAPVTKVPIWRLSLEKSYPLDAAEAYQMRRVSKEAKPFFETNIMRFRTLALETGWGIDLENRADYPITFCWRDSALVDRRGFTWSLCYPDPLLVSEFPGIEPPEVLIAPHSRRHIVLLPMRGIYRGMDWLSESERAIAGSFHPLTGTDPFTSGLLLYVKFRNELCGYYLLYKFERSNESDEDESRIAPTSSQPTSQSIKVD